MARRRHKQCRLESDATPPTRPFCNRCLPEHETRSVNPDLRWPALRALQCRSSRRWSKPVPGWCRATTDHPSRDSDQSCRVRVTCKPQSCTRTISGDHPGIKRLADTLVPVRVPHRQRIGIAAGARSHFLVVLDAERLPAIGYLNVLEFIAAIELDENSVLESLLGKFVTIVADRPCYGSLHVGRSCRHVENVGNGDIPGSTVVDRNRERRAILHVSRPGREERIRKN